MDTYKEFCEEYLKRDTTQMAMLLAARVQVQLLFEIRDLLKEPSH